MVLRGWGSLRFGHRGADTDPSASQLEFNRSYETIDWSQAQYSDCAFIALDVVPATPDGTTTTRLRALSEQVVEFDRVDFSREVRSRSTIGRAQ